MYVSEIDMLSPHSLLECLYLLENDKASFRLLAGGTDAVVRMKEGKWQHDCWLNLKNIDELKFIAIEKDEIHIGPLATHSEIISSPLLQDHADVLVQASREVGAAQMQNMGTIGGNIGTASPAGDTIPALFALGASIELTSITGKRQVSAEDFFIGPGKTVAFPNEIITKISFKIRGKHDIGIFQKLGPRKAQSISIVNVAISLSMKEGTKECLGGRIAFGSVGPTVLRAKKCEAMLSLGELSNDMISNISSVAWKEVMPISDIRASASYRRDMASALLERGLYRLMKRWADNERKPL
ncbi:xanthine dehydrogenase family protein subunit M [Fictibacillus enclensis]|uniref:FAD binding domain-containing protein n=1 Tax=Fictibacillus enclensis TaxID=1017270 RepID=UPI0025A28582|nr:xanthine dehydrogenase family protein subunit M [Fictibacillus enclensis]MDM5198418.1 xanthine dehydrogenase family protein subunit M [Fictibacillus enclensis]MDM5337621.1 xanthine dehydrogenase family protein subunit M [Fictibacillus enclensis]